MGKMNDGDSSKWVHAVFDRWDSCLKATFCGLANLRKRKYLILSTDWDSDRVTCPECLNSPEYKERIAKRMLKRMTQPERNHLKGMGYYG